MLNLLEWHIYSGLVEGELVVVSGVFGGLLNLPDDSGPLVAVYPRVLALTSRQPPIRTILKENVLERSSLYNDDYYSGGQYHPAAGSSKSSQHHRLPPSPIQNNSFQDNPSIKRSSANPGPLSSQTVESDSEGLAIGGDVYSDLVTPSSEHLRIRDMADDYGSEVDEGSDYWKGLGWIDQEAGISGDRAPVHEADTDEESTGSSN